MDKIPHYTMLRDKGFDSIFILHSTEVVYFFFSIILDYYGSYNSKNVLTRIKSKTQIY